MKVKKYKYTIELLSNTCFGSGEGNGSNIDVITTFDKFGFPIIPAKRIRGLLREKAYLLKELYGEQQIEELFGNSGLKSKLIIDDGIIKNRDDLKNELTKYTKEEISNSYIVHKTQTAVDEETGVAVKTSLRTIDTIRKGEIFEGSIEIDNCTDIDDKIIRDSIKLLRNVGLEKHRGYGEVKCSIENLTETNYVFKDITVSQETNYCLSYTIELESDLVLNLNSPNKNLDHIPGSVLQGYFAKYFCDKEFFNKMFFENLKFSNAYISCGNKEYIPAPYSLTAIKNDGKKVFSKVDGNFVTGEEQYVPVSGYINIDNDKITILNVKQDNCSHINKGKNNKVKLADDTGIFNIKCITSGQKFIGKIYGSKEVLSLLEDCVKNTDNIIRLGSSLSSQYGKCKFKINEIKLTNDTPIAPGEKVVVELISDAIIVDELGNNTLETQNLIDCIEGKGVFTNEALPSFIKTCKVGGYNAKWGMPKIQYYAFSKGTTIVLQCNKGVTINNNYIGIGNSEGFGEFVVRNVRDNNEFSKISLKEEIKVYNETITGAGTKLAEQIQLKRKGIEVENLAYNEAVKIASKKMSKSAIMRIYTCYSNNISDGNKEKFIELCKEQFRDELLDTSMDIIKGCNEKGVVFDKYIRSFFSAYKEISMKNSK